MHIQRDKCKQHLDKYLINEEGKTYCMVCGHILDEKDKIKRTHDEGV